MGTVIRFVKRIANALIPSKYSSKFDRLSEENQRTVSSTHTRSGW